VTRAQLRTAIQERLGFATDTATAQNEALNGAVRRLEGLRRWPWQEATSVSATLASGASTLGGLPSDLLHVDAVRLEEGTEYIELEYRAPNEVQRMLHLDRDTGTPQYWSKRGATIYVYPRAQTAYDVVTLEYVKDPTDMSADGDSPAAPATYHDVYVYGAGADLAIRERDWAMNQTCERLFTSRVKEMQEEMGQRQRQNATHIPRSAHWRQISGRN
jgi:hypothetical protein